MDDFYYEKFQKRGGGCLMHPKVLAAFWRDEKVEVLDAKAKLCALWLITAHADICGWTPIVSEKRFALETDCSLDDLQRTVEGLGNGLVSHEKGFWLRNFIRYQIGAGNSLSMNNVARSAAKRALLLPAEITKAIWREYPELKALIKGLPTPTQGERERESKSKGESKSDDTDAREGWTADDWANFLHPLFSGRREAELECKAAISSDIATGQDPVELERQVRLIVGYIEKQAPGGWSNAFIGNGRKFWLERKWRNPEAFAQRWDDLKKKNGAGVIQGKPAVAVRVQTHRDLPEPTCEWRPVLKGLFPIEECPQADYGLPWGLYEPDIRRDVECECKHRGLLPVDWMQPPVPEDGGGES